MSRILLPYIRIISNKFFFKFTEIPKMRTVPALLTVCAVFLLAVEAIPDLGMWYSFVGFLYLFIFLYYLLRP